MHVLTNTCACCRVPDDWLPPVEDQQAVIEVKRKVGPQEHGIPEQMSTVQFCLVCFTGAYVIMDTCRVAKAAFAKNANATSRPAVTTAVFVANASSGWCASCSHSFIDNVIAACQHPRYESHAQYAIISELCSTAVCTFCRITIVHGSTIVLGMATTRRSYYFLCVSLLNTPVMQQQQCTLQRHNGNSLACAKSFCGNVDMRCHCPLPAVLQWSAHSNQFAACQVFLPLQMSMLLLYMRWVC